MRKNLKFEFLPLNEFVHLNCKLVIYMQSCRNWNHINLLECSEMAPESKNRNDLISINESDESSSSSSKLHSSF